MAPEPRWTVETLAVHVEALRAAEEKFQAERDRRYTEIRTLSGELQAMRDREVARQAVEYQRRLKDLNHENARVSAASERSVSRELFDSRIKPIEDFIGLARGHGAGSQATRVMIAWVIAAIATLLTIGQFVFRADAVTPPAAQVIMVPAQPGTMLSTPQTPATAQGQ